jgi:dipeptidyl aminopeptidase/acylaminoacyl peptidase
MLTSALLALALAAGDAPRTFSVDDLLSLARVESPAVSPDGSRVAFTVARAAPGGDKLVSGLWIAPGTGGEPRRLTSYADERVSAPRFSPDGKKLAFLSNRGGTTQAWVLDLSGGEATRATSLPGGASAVLWTPDGASLLVAVDVDPRCGADAACNERSEAAAKDRPHVATRLLHRHWNAWRERVRTHVLRVPLDGGAAVDLTPGDRDAPPYARGGEKDLAVSPDGRTLYFVAVSDPVEATSTNADVYAVPLEGGEPRRVTSGPGWDGSPRPSPDGARLAWLSQPRAGFESDRFHVMVADAEGGGARDLTAAFDLSAEDLHWVRGGKALRFTASTEGSTALYEVDLRSGRVERVTDPAFAAHASGLSASSDGAVLAAVVDSMTDPPELGLLRRRGKGAGLEFVAVTSFARSALRGVPRPEVRPLSAVSADGTRVPGWLVLPPRRRAGERLPAVVLVHGGPQGNWGHAWTWRWNAMAFAAQGWAVVLPNPRGSTGWGQAYVDAISRRWGAAYDDVAAVLDAAIAAGDVDGGRTCAAGASFGGFLVHYMNGQTDRFRCLVAHAALFDLADAWATTDELWFPEWDIGGGPPWERPEEWERFSPSRSVARWKTPTLVSHGELDYRCTVDQGYAAFTALQRRGIRSKLLVFPDEGHWILRPKNSKVFYDVVFGWLGDHLGTAAGASAKAP